MTSLTTDKHPERDCCRLSDDFEILRRSSLFSGINLDVIKLFAYLSSRRMYKTGEYLITQTKKADQAFLIIQGEIEITVHYRDREIILQKLADNAVFGELSLLAQFSWFFNARAAENSDILVINRTVFQKVIEKYPEHKDKLIERVIQLRVDRMVDQTTHMLDHITSADLPPTKTVI